MPVIPAAVRATVLILILLVAAFLAAGRGFFDSADRALLDLRMSLTQKPASGEIAFVEIDARSLEAVGRWPWPRSVHGQILDRLIDAGAIDVFFDIDFAFPADPAGDQAFADALDRAGGSTYLPVFVQSGGIGAPDGLHVNEPHDAFASRSWPVVANVLSDPDGLVRRYPFGAEIDGAFIPSAAALLASQYLETQDAFQIDYSFATSSIPTISASDLIGDADIAAVVEGRSVVVGASAIELGDNFAVPVHGVIPGPLIHILATETLLAATAPRWVRDEIVIGVLALLLIGLQLVARRGLWSLFSALAVFHIVIEAVALALVELRSLATPTALLHPSLLAFAMAQLSISLVVSQWISRGKDVEIENKSRLLNLVFEDSTDAIVIVDQTGDVLMQSRSAEALFGQTTGYKVDLPSEIAEIAARVVDPEVSPADDMVHRLTLEGDGSPRFIEFSATRSELKDTDARDSTEDTHGVVTILARDVTQLREQERHIAYLSSHDERTGALRRGAFLKLLANRLEMGDPVAIFALNLHRFKTINLSLGRNVGDALLKEVVRRLDTCGKHLSSITRIEGDRFAFYIEATCDDKSAADLARSIMDLIVAPYRLDVGNAQIGAQIGYSVIEPSAMLLPADVLARAEEALDDARALGGSRLQAYDPVSSERRLRARDIERAMSGALENEEFHLTYQPQHRLSDGDLIGVEALVRWESSALGPVFPDEFIPIAESNGFILQLGRWVLQQAAKDAMLLPERIVMAVNVSGIQMLQGDIEAEVKTTLSETGLPPQRLCLELTETVLITPTDQMVEAMHNINWSGVTWALDDFGTGYSSMAYLSTLPLAKLKLDKAFTMKLDSDPSAFSIVRSAEVLCRGLGLKLLCEGVETDVHLQILKDLGCVEGQGYFFGKPQRLDDLLNQIEPTDRKQSSTA